MRLIPLLLTALATASPALAQRELPPPVGPAKDFKVPATRSFTLPNGLGVTLVPFGTVPKATIRLSVRTGGIDEPADRRGVTGLHGAYLNEGTATRSAADLAREFAGMGGSLDVAPGSDVTFLQAEVLGERAADAVRLVGDVIRNPAFPASELARLKADRVRELTIQLSQPQTLADERFEQLIWGDHPYGRLLPTEEQVRRLTVEDVRGYHAANVGARRSHLYVAGVFDAAQVERAVREAFGSWAAGPAPTALPAQAMTGRRVETIARPGAPQSTLYLGLPVADPSSPDWVPLGVANALLGGSFASRITSNIREQKGYTYSPYSMLVARKGTAYWTEVADVTTDVTGASLTEIVGEIERLRREPPPADELRGIQLNQLGIFTLRNSSRAGIIGQLQFVRLHGLGDQWLRDYTRNTMAVTPGDVQRMAQRYLDPAKMALVVVGDVDKVEPQLAPFRPAVP